MRLHVGLLAAALLVSFTQVPLDAMAQRSRARTSKAASKGSKKQKARSGKTRKARAKKLHRQRSRRFSSKSQRRSQKRARERQQKESRSLRRKKITRTRHRNKARERKGSEKQLRTPEALKKAAERFRKAGLEGRSAEVAAEHVTLGLLSDATPENPEDFLIAREEYVISYSKSRKNPNWAAWKLTKEHMGSAKRSGKFKSDTKIPESWGRAGKADYKGSGYTRGHLVSSGARTASPEANRKTFYFSNIVPQTEAQNNGPWNKFEQHARELAKSGKDVYMMAGPLYEGKTKTIGPRNVAVPSHIWKVAVVVPRGTPPGSIGKDSQVISMLMPNDSSVNKGDSYKQYKVKAKEIEKRAGVELFKSLPQEVRSGMLERVD